MTAPKQILRFAQDDNQTSTVSSESRQPLPQLPCYPCPHASSCCAYGTTVTSHEAAAIDADLGPGLVYLTRYGEWRTRVKNKRCVMHRDGGCSIHDRAYYPAMCRSFPWTDAETGEPYQYDVTICGEFEARPELVEIQRGASTAAIP
jgi:hypothetical protein